MSLIQVTSDTRETEAPPGCMKSILEHRLTAFCIRMLQSIQGITGIHLFSNCRTLNNMTPNDAEGTDSETGLHSPNQTKG